MTSAVSRIGTASTSSGRIKRRDRRLRHLPARRQPERGEREPDHLTARVAHEHGGRLARPEVEGEEAEQPRARGRARRRAAGRRSGSSRRRSRRRWRRSRRACPARPSMLSSRLKAFVMPTSQSSADRRRRGRRSRRSRPVGRRRSRSRPRRSGSRASRAAAASAGRRRDRTTKTIGAPPTMPASSHVGVDLAREQAGGDAGDEARVRCRSRRRTASRCSCQRSPDGVRRTVCPTDERSSAQIVSAATGRATMRGERAHRANASTCLLSRCVAVLSGTDVRARCDDSPARHPSLSRCAAGSSHQAGTARVRNVRRPLSRRGRDRADARRPAAGNRREARARSRAGRPWRASRAGTSPTTRSTRTCRSSTATSGWEDKTWRANEHSFSLLLERYVRPGMRVLEVGAAKGWAAQHLVPARRASTSATDILADPKIGLGRGAFYEHRVGPSARAGRRRASAVRRGRPSTSRTASRRSTTRSISARWCARWRASRAAAASSRAERGDAGARPEPARSPIRPRRRGYGINEHVHTL